MGSWLYRIHLLYKMKHGVKRVKRIKGTASTRTFGATSPVYTPFNLDAFGDFPDQNAEGHPEDCTIYTQNSLCEDEDKVPYNRDFLKRKVVLKNNNPNGPYDINDSLECTVVYGVQKLDETTDEQAYTHRRGRDFRLEKVSGMDWYDSAISVMQSTGRTLSIAGPWFPIFEQPILGVLPDTFPLTWPIDVPGHNFKVYGLNANGHLMSKTWQGTHFGNKGETYLTRSWFNKYMSMAGTGAFMVSKGTGSVIEIQYGLLYTLKFTVALLLRKLLLQ